MELAMGTQQEDIHKALRKVGEDSRIAVQEHGIGTGIARIANAVRREAEQCAFVYGA